MNTAQLRLEYPLTPRARRVLLHAQAIAKVNGHEHIGADHILMAAFTEEHGLVPVILSKSGIRQKAKVKKMYECAKQLWGTK